MCSFCSRTSCSKQHKTSAMKKGINLQIKKAEGAFYNMVKNNPNEEIGKLKARYGDLERAHIEQFEDYPLSEKTLMGLADMKYIQPTDIQRKTIALSLQGKDILGVAQTGSGKTLAFIVPLLEHLYVNKWTRMDGIGAIVISPTRELSYQIFETLKRVGKHHDFSAGLIIGGKNLKFERKRMDQCNILICTPGRLLQHMDENPLFNAVTLRVLVLDEADRCLDLGFEQTLNGILENLPRDRQTLLFSATQTNSVSALARLSLNELVAVTPEPHNQIAYTSPSVVTNLYEKSGIVPKLLQQSYVVMRLEDKITMLWSFLLSHQRQKIIVFLTSCKQVKYMYEIFSRLRPGLSLLALYGTLHQDRRIGIYNTFVQSSNVVLFATDIASRGLDFPCVSWVVQLDCPEDVFQYIHRAGRSARNHAPGESLLVLMPSEEQVMVEQLQNQNLQVRQIHVDPRKLHSPIAKIESHLAQSAELKASAQRAFAAYIKSIFLMRNKRMFNVFKVDFDAFAKSLGLAVTPRVHFLERYIRQNQKTVTLATAEKSPITLQAHKATDGNSSWKFKGNKVFAVNNSDSDTNDDDSILTLKRVCPAHGIPLETDENGDNKGDAALSRRKVGKKHVTKASLVKKTINKNIQFCEKRRFDEEGNEIINSRKQKQSAVAKKLEAADHGGIDLLTSIQLLNEEDKYDRNRFRQLVKQRRKQQNDKLKRQFGECTTDGVDGDKQSSGNDFSADANPMCSNYSHIKTGSWTQLSDFDAADEETCIETVRESSKKKSKVTAKLTLQDAEVIAQQLLANS